ncbi:hypothetical protein ACFXTH_034675 [Malus domestica]
MDIGRDDVCGFECNICLALAQDPVITPCGHLYCWSCLMKWLFKAHSNNECPICRTGIEFSQLIFSCGKSKIQSNPKSPFECKICSDLARDPIVTLCGHLYCWCCLNKWLNKWNSNSNCWVCKAVIEDEKLVPLYGKGTKSHGVSRPGPWSATVGTAGTALSLEVKCFVQRVFATIGALFRFGRRTMEVFMTRVLPIIAILVMLHPYLPRERKNDLVEKVLVWSLWSWLIVVIWDVLNGNIKRHKKRRGVRASRWWWWRRKIRPELARISIEKWEVAVLGELTASLSLLFSIFDWSLKL